tara:strand:- start:663 stop:941 length:279 start_codon:yes stop_codon:yes gene_type:complete
MSMPDRSSKYGVMSCHALHFMIPSCDRIPKLIKSILEKHNLYPAVEKFLLHQFLMPLSGLNTIKLNSENTIKQGTVCAFFTINLPYSHHSLK